MNRFSNSSHNSYSRRTSQARTSSERRRVRESYDSNEQRRAWEAHVRTNRPERTRASAHTNGSNRTRPPVRTNRPARQTATTRTNRPTQSGYPAPAVDFAGIPWKPMLLIVGFLMLALAIGRISSCAPTSCSRFYEHPEPYSYVSNSIINRMQPIVAPGQDLAYLAKHVEEQRELRHREQMEQLIRNQRDQVASSTNQAQLNARDTTFRRGASIPSNFESSSRKVVYLTFDDGPSAVTPDVLDVLDFYGAKATFFVTNINPSYASLIKDAYQRGHTIGLHTSTHKFNEIYASTDAFFADLDAIAATVRSQIGYEPCFIRFAGGSSNTISTESCIGIMSVLSEEVQNRGYQYYDWNFDSTDASGYLPVQQIVEAATSATPELNGNNLIMLLHDGRGKQTTAEALPFIIEYYLREGYVFEAINPDSLVVHQQVAN